MIELNLPEGYYSVSVYLLACDEESGAYMDNGYCDFHFLLGQMMCNMH